MKNIIYFVTVLLLIGCSSDDANTNKIPNSFSVNGNNFKTDFAYTIPISNENPIITRVIFSSADRNTESYTEAIGRFELIRHVSDETLLPGEYSYSTSNSGLIGEISEILFYKNLEIIDGNTETFPEEIASTFLPASNFVYGRATINSISFDSLGIINQINIDYIFEWDGIKIEGNYNGEVRINP